MIDASCALKRPVRAQDLAQRQPLHQFHPQPDVVPGLVGAIHAHHVGMPDAREQLRLLQEVVGPLPASAGAGRQQLQCNVNPEFRIVCAVDRSERSLSDRPEDHQVGPLARR